MIGPAAMGAGLMHPLEPGDTSSPRATLRSFIDSCNKIYLVIQFEQRDRRKESEFSYLADRILRCLDLSEEPEYLRRYLGGEAAACLKEVMDRIELPAYDQIPDVKAVEAAAATGGLLRWRIPHTDITIARVQQGPHQGQYAFSPDTIRRAKTFYQRVQRLPYRTGGPEVSEGLLEWFLSEPGSPALAAVVHRLPGWTRTRVYGQAVWQWVGLATTILVGLLLMFLAYRLGRWHPERIRKSSVVHYCAALLFPIAAMLVPLAVRNIVTDYLVISGSTLVIVKFSANVVFLFAVLVVLVGTSNRIAEIIIASPRIHPKGLDAQFIRITCRLLSLVAATIVFLEGGQYLGIPLTTLLAGAGVGGLTVALAAQDTLKNLFGSMMIMLDKPYRVGERIAVKGYDGVVEEIGLRSTKIRLLTGHVATIPNEEMARSDIENIGRRPFIRRIADLRIPLDTPRQKIQKAVEVIRAALTDHEGMDPEFPPRVYFNEFNPDSFNIRVIYWYNPPNYWDFLAFSERLNLEIFRAFDQQGIRFSLPARLTYETPSAPAPIELKFTNGTEPSPRSPVAAAASVHGDS